MATTVARLQAVLSADTRDFDRGMDKSQTKMGKVGKAAGLAGAAIAGGLVVGLTKSVGAARDAQVAQFTLEQALKSAGISHEKYGKQIDASIQKTSKLAALDDEDLSEAFSKLVRTTKDVTKATDGMNLAADIARSRHISLEAATKMVERAYNGQDKAFSRVGVIMPKVSEAYDALRARVKELQKEQKGATDAERAALQAKIDSIKSGYDAAKAADKQASAQDALAEAQKRFGGAAQQYGKSGAAAQERFQVAIENLQEAMGSMLLPMITKVANSFASLANFMEAHRTLTKAIIITLGALSAAMLTVSVGAKIVTAATQAYTAVQWLLNAALTANPIGVVIVALAALGAALVVAYKRSETFRDIVQGAFAAVKAAMNKVQDSFEWIRDHAGPAIAAMWKIAKVPLEAFKLEWEAVAAVLDKIKDAIGWVADHIPKLPKLPDLNPFGDPADPNMTAPPATGGALGKLTGNSTIDPGLWDELGLAKQMGLVLTSGYRPGAITKHGTRSDHSIFPSKAIDVAGSASQMASFFMALLGRPGIKQAFYDPLGSIFNGVRSSYREGGHSDHVHVATYDRGGYLKPGWNLAYNGLGRPEPVGFGGNVSVYVGGSVLAERDLEDVVVDAIRRARNIGRNV